jgi:hypothetical protein
VDCLCLFEQHSFVEAAQYSLGFDGAEKSHHLFGCDLGDDLTAAILSLDDLRSLDCFVVIGGFGCALSRLHACVLLDQKEAMIQWNDLPQWQQPS